jgi:RNase P subunit RPR2
MKVDKSEKQILCPRCHTEGCREFRSVVKRKVKVEIKCLICHFYSQYEMIKTNKERKV